MMLGKISQLIRKTNIKRGSMKEIGHHMNLKKEEATIDENNDKLSGDSNEIQ